MPKEPVSQVEILTRALTEAEALQTQGAAPELAVFDLDSTVFELSRRVSKIIDTFAVNLQRRSRFPELCAALDRVEIRRSDWSIAESLARIGINESTNPEFWSEIHGFWSDCFFSNDFLHHDEPVLGAVSFIHELRNRGSHIMYLTGRDKPRMYQGTVRSLINHGFPLEDHDIQLVMKPEPDQNDAKFKLDVLELVQPSHGSVWLFENEPVNLNLVAHSCPDIRLVFIESTHSGREPVLENIMRIQNFEWQV